MHNNYIPDLCLSNFDVPKVSLFQGLTVHISTSENTKRYFVLNTWLDGDELEELLHNGNPGTIPGSAKKMLAN